MPRYRVRFQSPISRHYRVTHVNADSPEAAVQVCARIDAALVADENQVHDHLYEVAYVIERGQPIPPVEEWITQPPPPEAEPHLVSPEVAGA